MSDSDIKNEKVDPSFHFDYTKISPSNLFNIALDIDKPRPIP
jgi:hypothetical protein